MSTYNRSSVRETFTDAAALATGLTCLKIAAPFVQQMAFGYTDADIARLADTIIDAPSTFIGTFCTGSFLIAAGRYLHARWTGANAVMSGNGNKSRYTSHNY